VNYRKEFEDKPSAHRAIAKLQQRMDELQFRPYAERSDEE
jgi:hypothetical protein